MDIAPLLPHLYCFSGRADLVWLHFVIDLSIAIAYFIIPIVLIVLIVLIVFIVKRKSRISFHWAIVLFAAFIVMCGLGHVIAVATLWKPVYYLQGIVKLMTAVVSLATAAAVLPILPRLLALRTPEELEAVNQELAQSVAKLAKLNEQLLEEVRAKEFAEESLKENIIKLKSANEELEQFTFIASHDLQAPLRNVSAFAQLLINRHRANLSGEAIEFMDFIGQGVKQMQSLIQDLLALSRIGRSTSSGLEKISLSPEIQRVSNLLKDAVSAKNAIINADNLPDIQAQKGLLFQLFQNLIANALKFNKPDCPPVIEVSAELHGEYWHISVADNGVGIQPNQLENIFVAFRRLHTQDEYEGTGIGLAICKKIVTFHGGTIHATSNGFGHGTCFHIMWPVNPQLPSPN